MNFWWFLLWSAFGAIVLLLIHLWVKQRHRNIQAFSERHRNIQAFSEWNLVQSSRSKLNTCLRKGRLLRFQLNNTASSDGCSHRVGNCVLHDLQPKLAAKALAKSRNAAISKFFWLALLKFVLRSNLSTWCVPLHGPICPAKSGANTYWPLNSKIQKICKVWMAISHY